MFTLRLFVALETPPDIRADMARLQSDLRSAGADVRWEPPEKFHATLKFLGDTPADLLPEIVYTTEGVLGTCRPPVVRYRGLGCFPNRRDPRVIWIGVEDDEETVLSLQRSLEAAFLPLGFKADERVFHAHVTLGRVRGRRGIESLLGRMESATFESHPVSIPDVVLIQSELKPAGSVYTTLRVFPLNR